MSLSQQKPDLFAQSCVMRNQNLKIIRKIKHATIKKNYASFYRASAQRGRTQID